ncbi:MAG: glycosyltransferase, partial [Candidatus Omnitrophica bacterium]|nr:glycosyltransferase [Candidatus Omnitrophota bacterium]
GPQRAALEAATRARHLDGSIKFLGCRDDVPDLLSACDLFVLATYSEGMPYSVMEAMAAGLPVITARLEGMEELIEHGRTGWLVAPGDVGAYTRAIETLLHDPSRRRAIGDAAREWIRTHATLQHHVERTQAALLAWYARSRRGRGRPQRGPFLLQRVRLYAREEGFVQALKRCAEVVMSPCYRRACLWFLSRPVSDPVVQVTPRVACAVRLATPEDAQALAALGFDSYEEICALLRSPRDACMIAEHDGRVVAFQWIALGPRALWISPIERSMSLAADEAHLVRCRALRAFRGRGIIPALERDVLAWLAGRGVRTVSTDIGHDHQLSLSTFEKLGLRRTLRVAFTRVGWWSKVRCHRPRLHASLPVRVLLVLEHFSQQDPLIACADECGPRDVKVTVAAPPPVSEPAHGSMARRQPTLRLPDSSSFWGVVRMASALRRLRRRRAFDVLHCPVGARLPIVMLAARWAGLKHIVVSVRDLRWADGPFTLRTHLTAWAIQAAMQRAEAVFCYSDVLRKACVARGWVREERAHRLSDDRAPRDDDGPRSSEAARRVLGLRGADPVVATLIPLTYGAAPWRFLTLCRCLRRRLPQCQFVIAGTGSLIRMLTQQRDEAGLADCLQVIHRDGDVRLLLNACDAFVHFSDVPEASLAALEAQACARWVIELESGGRSDVRAGAEEAAPGLEIVARSMAEVLSHPPRAVLLGQAAQAGIRNAFGPRYLAVQFAMQMRALVSADVVTVSQTPWMCRDACPSLSGYSG